jgi:hypothetical protein
MMDVARIRLRRIRWKRPPTDDERADLDLATMFGPTVVERGNVWWFLPILPTTPWGQYDPTPQGWRQIN